VKLVQVLPRLALLSLAAAVLVGLTVLYGGLVRTHLASPQEQEFRLHHPSAPQFVDEFPEFFAAVTEVALFALMGRLIFRLRLAPAPRDRRPILLNLRYTRPGLK